MWLDAGTFNSLLQASQYVQTIQERHNILVNHPQDIAKRKMDIGSNWLLILVYTYQFLF